MDGCAKWMAACTAVILLAGCGSETSLLRSGSTAALSAGDFAGDGEGGSAAMTPSSGGASRAARDGDVVTATGLEPTVTGPLAASEGILNVNAVAGPPPAVDGPKPAAAGASVLVDAKVGEINGKPVYAGKFLESRASKLRADAVEMRRKNPRGWREEWRNSARSSFVGGLNGMIEDELLRAEALANFTPEQRAGFFNFMQTVSDRLASENRGSVSAAQQALQQKGQTMNDYLRDTEVRELVAVQLNRFVRDRVNVSWRDIKQRYEMLYNQLNEPPKARFRLVQISARTPEAVEAFAAGLAAGKPFEELARLPSNANNAANGGLEEKAITADRATMTFYTNPELNLAAQTLKPGETAGPFKLGTFTSWIHLDDIVVKSRSLYDLQILLEREIRETKMQNEKRRYLMRLLSKSQVTSTRDMTERLLQIAEERYLPPEQ